MTKHRMDDNIFDVLDDKGKEAEKKVSDEVLNAKTPSELDAIASQYEFRNEDYIEDWWAPTEAGE